MRNDLTESGKSGDKLSLVSRFLAVIKRFSADRRGATAIEYGLIAAMIALAIMVGAQNLGSSLNDKFKDIATDLN
jgi:pilus assembly protein Flp/PilA